MDIIEAIQSRNSVRQYTNQKIEAEKRQKLNELCSELNRESGLNIQIIYDEPKCFSGIMAHYGKFSGVENYIAIVGPKGKNLDELSGYYGQKLVLKAQEIGLNTCWVAMTHGKSKVVIEKGQKQSILISLGYGANQGVKHKSKNVSELAVISKDDPKWYLDGVNAALLAPTAMNQQKFKIERVGENAKITALNAMLAKFDLGIVKCNFEVASGHKTV